MSLKILVVDDEQDMVDLLTYNLRERGYEVLVAFNGLQAIHKARTFQPDLVLLDLMLEGMDGFTVCEILRHQPSTAHTPVVIVTALHGEMTRRNGLQSGADDFISKPFSPDQLIRKMEAAIETRRRKARELEDEEAREQVVRQALRHG